MHFITIRELSKSPSKYVKLASENDDIVVTRNGHPYAIISRMDGSELEDYILAKHFNLEKELARARQEHEAGRTKNIHVLLDEINKASDAISG